MTLPTLSPPRRPGPRPLWAGLATTALLAMTACASTPAPTEQMAVTRAAVDRASGPVAAEASGDIAAARDKLRRAERAMANKDYDIARQLAAQAEADVALAEARAREARSTTALTEVRDGIRALRDELARQ